MKLRFVAEPKDVLYFILFSIFLFFLVAVGVGNISSLSETGMLIGFNPLPGLSPENFPGTLLFFLIFLFAIMFLVSSYFFDREKGFGLFKEKKNTDGYSKWAKPIDIKESRGVKEINESDKEYTAGGIPLFTEKGKVWVDDGESHTLIIGATGSGKTLCVVRPTVKILAKKGESMIITDPKAEIYEENANYLRSLGYNIILLNFRNPQKGNMWNPLSLPYKLYKKGNIDKSNELLRDVATNILHEDKTDDPFWQNTSADYFVAMVQALFQDTDEDKININSVINMLTVGEEKYGASNFAKEYFKMKDSSNPAYINAAGTIDAPNETKGSIISVFRQKVNIFAMAENLSEMLSKSDFDMMNIGRNKTAVFLIVQDEKRTYHALTTIFVKQCYESLIDVAQENGGKLPVRTNFILDEFANMPELKDITTMITAARSRQIRFNLIIQNFSQLNQVYGKENAETVKGNCGNIIYLLSSELSALEEISKLCGDRKVKSKSKDKPDETRPLVTVTDLQRLEFKTAIIIRQRMAPFKVKLKAVDEYNWNILSFDKATYIERQKNPINVFDMREYVKSRKKDMLSSFGTSSNGMMPNVFPNIPNSNVIGGNHFKDNSKSKDDEFDVDELIKKIDAKIAQLEKEDEGNKSDKSTSISLLNDNIGFNNKLNDTKNDISETNINYNSDNLKKIVEPDNSNTVKINENIDKIIKDINDDDTTDDQFFDDFFSDE